MDLTEESTIVDDAASTESHDSAIGVGLVAASHRKPRVTVACQRCKRRKQRCDGSHPMCGSCQKANVECVYKRALRPRYPGGKSLYISVLEERIAFLEEKLPEFGQDHLLSPTSSSTPQLVSRPLPGRPPTVDNVRRSSVESDSEEEKASLVDGVAYLSLCASGTTDTAPEPFYVGSSSGATIARLIQTSIFRSPKSRVNGSSSTSPKPYVLRPSMSDFERRMSSVPPLSDEPALNEFPYGPQAQTLFSVFFDRLHTRWPVLDRRLFCTIFEKQWDQGALPIVQRSLLHLIYAISARFLQLIKKNCDVDPEQHFAAAIEPMDYILEQHNLATVQFLALLAIYGQRSPYGAGSWSQVRYSLALCIELGLHRKQTPHMNHRTGATDLHDRADQEVRKRVFWACYCLDRMTTTTLGRTFGIADRDINVDLPSESPEFWHLAAGSPEEWANVKPFVHIIRLRRLQSKVFGTVWRVDRDILSSSSSERLKLDDKIEKVKKRLDEWMVGVPTPSSGSQGIMWMYGLESSSYDSMDYFSLQYHKIVLSLYTALLPTLLPSDHRFSITTRSSATICNMYKTLIAQKTLSYTVVALHSCFIAGLTLVYCLWKEPSLFEYSSLDATRSCSLCLTIFGEKWPGAVKYREIFDAMSGSLLKSIVGGGESMGSDGRRAPLDVEIPLPTSSLPAIPEVASEGGACGMASGEDKSAAAQQRSQVLFSAVKDAFMEVDNESAGMSGWQGWRMFNEMVQSDIATAPRIMDMVDGDNEATPGHWEPETGQGSFHNSFEGSSGMSYERWQ